MPWTYGALGDVLNDLAQLKRHEVFRVHTRPIRTDHGYPIYHDSSAVEPSTQFQLEWRI